MNATVRKVLITGANGFVGRAVCTALERAGWHIRPVFRAAVKVPPGLDAAVVGDITAVRDWRPWLEDVHGVVHLAALTHSGGLHGHTALARYRDINVKASALLGAQARECGIAKFVFMSSIKVNGEATTCSHNEAQAFMPDDEPAPADNYGQTKLEAERALGELFESSPADLTVLRSPLVYGPGQKGNMNRLMSWVARGLPLPLAGIRNQRSLIYVENLAGAVVCALGDAGSDRRCYTLADVTLSTPELIIALADVLEVQARLFNVPAVAYRWLSVAPGVHGLVSRLTGDLAVDATAARNELGWRPTVGFDQALANTALWFRQTWR
jgi:nucleoside-diphosphate-sugar epimerase